MHGIDLGPLTPRIPKVIKSVDLAPAVFVDDLPRLRERLDEPPADLTLIGRRALRSNNSWMHNSARLVKGKNDCTLMMHPDDAQSRGL